MCHRIQTAVVSAPVVVVFQTGHLTLLLCPLNILGTEEKGSLFLYGRISSLEPLKRKALSSPPAPLLAPRERKVSGV